MPAGPAGMLTGCASQRMCDGMMRASGSSSRRRASDTRACIPSPHGSCPSVSVINTSARSSTVAVVDQRRISVMRSPNPPCAKSVAAQSAMAPASMAYTRDGAGSRGRHREDTRAAAQIHHHVSWLDHGANRLEKRVRARPVVEHGDVIGGGRKPGQLPGSGIEGRRTRRGRPHAAAGRRWSSLRRAPWGRWRGRPGSRSLPAGCVAPGKWR